MLGPASNISLRASPVALQRGLLELSFIPPVLRPIVRAYLFGYVSAVGPRILTLILQRLTRRKRRRLSQGHDTDTSTFRQSALYILNTGFDVKRFPTFCAVLAGGSTLLQGPLKTVINRFAGSLSQDARKRFARWLSTFISSWVALKLLHSASSPAYSRWTTKKDNGQQSEPRLVQLGGRTLDLTLFTATRAVDVIVGELWSQHRARRKAAHRWTRTEQFVTSMIDPAVFSVSCAFIMWSWFYYPNNLPPSYNKWITSAASVDLRLIEALRRCKFNELRYGEDTGAAPLLGSMCVDHNLPYEWGDPEKAIPFPCEIVHMGCGSSCEYHALSRLVRSWKWSMYTYLPLALAFKLRKPTQKNIVFAFLSAARSSAFLGTFIMLFYYGVCLGRTRVGPHIIGKDIPSRQKIDSGVCVGTGCFLCGWSVLIETASRRKDMALFVAPRALATVVPRKYPIEKQWRESMIFSASAAVVMTCVLENPKRVRGVLGGLLNMIMKT